MRNQATSSVAWGIAAAAILLSCLVACVGIRPDRSGGKVPEIQAEWAVAPDLSFAVVTVRNNGSRPIKVDPATAFLPDRRIGTTTIWPTPERELVQPVISPVDASDQPIPMSVILNRPQAFPVIIAPGETRKIKIAVEGSTTIPDGRRARAVAVRCSLWRDGKELTRQTIARSAGWKRW